MAASPRSTEVTAAWCVWTRTTYRAKTRCARRHLSDTYGIFLISASSKILISMADIYQYQGESGVFHERYRETLIESSSA
eukprot:scaffold1593_cov193-Alexandrium_tamarense.AAC.121